MPWVQTAAGWVNEPRKLPKATTPQAQRTERQAATERRARDAAETTLATETHDLAETERELAATELALKSLRGGPGEPESAAIAPLRVAPEHAFGATHTALGAPRSRPPLQRLRGAVIAVTLAASPPGRRPAAAPEPEPEPQEPDYGAAPPVPRYPPPYSAAAPSYSAAPRPPPDYAPPSSAAKAKQLGSKWTKVDRTAPPPPVWTASAAGDKEAHVAAAEAEALAAGYTAAEIASASAPMVAASGRGFPSASVLFNALENWEMTQPPRNVNAAVVDVDAILARRGVTLSDTRCYCSLAAAMVDPDVPAAATVSCIASPTPVAVSRLAVLMKRGVVTPDTKVWARGFSGWLPLRQAIAVNYSSDAAATAPLPGETPEAAAARAAAASAAALLEYEGLGRRWLPALAHQLDVAFHRVARGAGVPAASTILTFAQRNLSLSGVLVKLHVYDVTTSGAAKGLNWLLSKATKEGAYHGALEVFGQEWSFGWNDDVDMDGSPSTGVFWCDPMQNRVRVPILRHSLVLFPRSCSVLILQLAARRTRTTGRSSSAR